MYVTYIAYMMCMTYKMHMTYITHETTLSRYACTYHFSRFSARRGVGSIRAFVFTCCVVFVLCMCVCGCVFPFASICREIRLVAVVFANLESPSVRFPVPVRFLLPLLLLLPFVLLISLLLLLLSRSSGSSCNAHGMSHIMFLIISSVLEPLSNSDTSIL